jgi:hypothetical protein
MRVARSVVAMGVAAGLFGLVSGAPDAHGAPPIAGAAGTSSRVVTGDEADCGPIGSDDTPLVSARAEPGVLPSQSRGGGSGPGDIVPLPPSEAPTPTPNEAAEETLLVLPKGADGTVPTDFELAAGAAVVASYFSPVLCATVVRVKGAPGSDAAALVARAPAEAVTAPNHIYVSAQAELTPGSPDAASGDDPYRPLQWGLERTGAAQALAVSDGRGARVALLDSAPDVAHRELAGVRVVAVPDPPAPAAAVHGTLMAGVTNAAPGNDYGIAGIAPGAELFAIPVCRPVAADALGDECPLFELLRGIDLAWEQRAQVLNVSLVGPPNVLLRRAMDRMDGLGVIVVAAAGNEGVAEPRYPAAYPSVIGVGAIDRAGRTYARGNRGSAVELLAPGVEILSTVPGNRFAFGDGTSLAAAHVTGVLALAIAASGDPIAARAAFFEAAQARASSPGNEPAALPTACAVLAVLGMPCP